MISERDRVRCAGIQQGVQFIELAGLEIDPAVAKMIPHAMSLRYKVIPVSRTIDMVKVAMATPLDVQAIGWILPQATGLEPFPLIAVEDEILEAIFSCFGAAVDVGDIIAR